MLQLNIFAAINSTTMWSLLLITSHYFNIFREIAECFQQLTHDLDCRTIVLTAAGKIFSAGNSYNIVFFLQNFFIVWCFVTTHKLIMN